MIRYPDLDSPAGERCEIRWGKGGDVKLASVFPNAAYPRSSQLPTCVCRTDVVGFLRG